MGWFQKGVYGNEECESVCVCGKERESVCVCGGVERERECLAIIVQCMPGHSEAGRHTGLLPTGVDPRPERKG